LFRSPIVRALLGILAIIVLYFMGVGVRRLYGSRVDIRNAGYETMRHVTLKVESGGKVVELPDVKPGDHRSLYVQTPEKSRVTLTITDSRNTRNVTVFTEAVPGECYASVVTFKPGHYTDSEEFHQSTCWRGWLDFLAPRHS
jgi:hypothetical protein